MEIPGDPPQNLIKHFPLVILKPIACQFHGHLSPPAHSLRGPVSVLRQAKHCPVAAAAFLDPGNQPGLLHFCQGSGNGSLIFFAELAQAGSGDSIRMTPHGNQALGMGALQAKLCHLHSFDPLNIPVDTGNGRGKQRVLIDHVFSFPDSETPWLPIRCFDF